MAKCNECGKKSFFLFVNSDGLCSNCKRSNDTSKNDKFRLDAEKWLIDNDKNYGKFKNELEISNQQLDRLNKAKELVKENKDYYMLIDVYETVLLKEKTDLVGTIHSINLAEYYYKTNQFDKAWGYLNGLFLEKPLLSDKIRDVQHKILKKEGKYQDAVLMLMGSFMYIARDTKQFNRLSLEKKLKPIVKKLNMFTDEHIAYLCSLIANQIKDNTFDEVKLREDITLYFENKSQ